MVDAAMKEYGVNKGVQVLFPLSNSLLLLQCTISHGNRNNVGVWKKVSNA
jgi:hypothetical protein